MKYFRMLISTTFVLCAMGLAMPGLTLASNAKGVGMLFYYAPEGCPHSANQKPRIEKFEATHPEVTVARRAPGSLNEEEKALLGTITGYPITVIHQDGHKIVIRGEASETELEAHYMKFKASISEATASESTFEKVIESDTVCF